MADTAAVTLLRPVRVLVAGDDHAVVENLRDGLVKLGFHAMSTTRQSGLADLAAVERVNVVILETSGGLAAAVETASVLEALPQRVRVLLAAGRRRAATKLGFDTIDPNGSIEELAAAVHHAYRHRPSRSNGSRA